MAKANMRAVAKEIRPYVRTAVSKGWTLSSTGHNHLCLTSPSGRKILFSRTFSDPRGPSNFKRDMQKAGVAV